MATTKKTKSPKKATPKQNLRVLAWRVSVERFDAIDAACARLKITKTTLLNEGIVLALTKRGEKSAAETFGAD